MSDEPLAVRALQRIEDHIEACSTNYGTMIATFKEVKDAIKDTNRLLMSFIAFVIATVVGFAGYTYVQNQALASALAASRAASAVAVSQIPSKTAEAVTAKLPVQTPSQDN